MSIRLCTGDLLASKCDILVNTVNCVGVMGAGIAVEFKKRYPEMYKNYTRMCNNNYLKLGDIYVYIPEEGPIVYNLMTQGVNDVRGYKSIALATYEAIYLSLKNMIDHAKDNHINTIGIPKIGAGLGGLEWEKVAEIVNRAQLFGMVEITVCYI